MQSRARPISALRMASRLIALSLPAFSPLAVASISCSLLSVSVAAAQEATQPTAPSAPGWLLIEVKALLIPVVVRDAHDQVVGDLSQSDFDVFDQGKRQPMTGFSVVRSASAAVGDAAASPSPESAPPQASAPTRSIVILFDDRHLDATGLTDIQNRASKMFAGSIGPDDRAVVLSYYGVNSGMTNNTDALVGAVQRIKSHAANLADRARCPDVDYYSANQILNRHDDSQYQVEIERAANCSHSRTGDIEAQVHQAANEALVEGDQDAMLTLSYIRDVVHTMEKLPGRRTLIFVSPGFLNYSDEAMRMESQIVNIAARANIAISALDARGLTGGMVGASQNGGGSIFAQITGKAQSNAHESSSENDDPMAQLAEGTGGSFVRGANDLEQQFRRAAVAPDATYLLEISLNSIKPNGSYHALRVKVKRDGVKIQARRGYFAPKQH